MRSFIASYRKIKWFNGGKSETVITRNIEARTLQSATNKAKRMQAYGSAKKLVSINRCAGGINHE